jgi:acyl-CoA synthetase (AMP-forming)/AMP-acid ligase II
MSAGAPRAALDDAILKWMREPSTVAGPATHAASDDERFEALALALFAHQYEHCEPYARFCRAGGATPSSVRRWQDVPAVPSGSFKELPLRSFAARDTCKVFRTSGTAGARRGELHLDTLELYEASLLPPIRELFFADLAVGTEKPLAAGGKIALRVLAPAPEEAPDSSLSHMFGCMVAAFGSSSSGFDLRAGKLDVDSFHGALESCCERGEAVAVCGTAFAFVHWLDALAGRGGFALPSGSRVLETGGFKGRSREVPREELRAQIASALGIPESSVVNQYGMTELGSQFYDSVLVDPGGPRRKLGPPWVRVRLVDPETGRDAKAGEPGLITVHDLANTGSIAAVQTADLGRRIEAPGSALGAGFDVLGRSAGAEERGCSIAVDAMLGGR